MLIGPSVLTVRPYEAVKSSCDVHLGAERQLVEPVDLDRGRSGVSAGDDAHFVTGVVDGCGSIERALVGRRRRGHHLTAHLRVPGVEPVRAVRVAVATGEQVAECARLVPEGKLGAGTPCGRAMTPWWPPSRRWAQAAEHVAGYGADIQRPPHRPARDGPVGRVQLRRVRPGRLGAHPVAGRGRRQGLPRGSPTQRQLRSVRGDPAPRRHHLLGVAG